MHEPVVSNELVEAVNLQFPQSLETIENLGWKFHYFVSTEYPMNQHSRITTLFNNMRNLKFKAQLTSAFFATVNQMFGGSSQLPTMLSELYSTI